MISYREFNLSSIRMYQQLFFEKEDIRIRVRLLIKGSGHRLSCFEADNSVDLVSGKKYFVQLIDSKWNPPLRSFSRFENTSTSRIILTERRAEVWFRYKTIKNDKNKNDKNLFTAATWRHVVQWFLERWKIFHDRFLDWILFFFIWLFRLFV